jgi:hypothetical protein
VRFADLEVPLTVIAANLRTRQLEFYSTGKTPTMEVAEAVRRSMSIPLAFEPQGGLIVDGGIYANFPAFTLTEEFDGLWPPESISHTRPKVGFALDDAAMAPNSWRLARAKFQPKGDPPAVDFLEVLEGILLAAVGLDQFNLRGFRMPDVEVMAPVKFLEVALETGAGRRNVQDVTRKLLATSMFATAPYFDVSIPLNGFHWLDFAVNLKKDDLDSIRQRGWRATVEELAAPSSGDEPLIGGEGRTRINPYGPRPGEGLSQDLEARVSALEADMQTLKDFRELVLLGAHRLSGGQVPLQRGDAHLLPLNGGGQGEVSPAGGDVTDPAELPPEPAMDPSLNG